MFHKPIQPAYFRDPAETQVLPNKVTRKMGTIQEEMEEMQAGVERIKFSEDSMMDEDDNL